MVARIMYNKYDEFKNVDYMKTIMFATSIWITWMFIMIKVSGYKRLKDYKYKTFYK